MSQHRARLTAIVLLVAVTLVSAALIRGSEGQALQGEYKIGVLEPLDRPAGLRGQAAPRGLRDHARPDQRARRRHGQEARLRRGRRASTRPRRPARPTASSPARASRSSPARTPRTLCGAASEAASRQNVIYWESSCVDPRFNKRGLKNVFRTEIDGTGFGWYNIEFIAKHLAPRFNLKPNQIKIAFLSEDSSYGQGVTESARRAGQEGVRDAGGGAVEYYAFASTNDFSPIIAKLKQLNPDVVHHIARSNDAVLFWRQSREQNFMFKALVHAGATGYGSPDFGKALGADGNGPFVLAEPGRRPAPRGLPAGGPEARAGLHRGGEEAHRRRALGEPPPGRRGPVAAQARARPGQDRRAREVPRGGHVAGPAGGHACSTAGA